MAFTFKRTSANDRQRAFHSITFAYGFYPQPRKSKRNQLAVIGCGFYQSVSFLRL